MPLKAIKPDKLSFSKDMTKALTDATNETLNKVKHDFERTTQGWRTKVKFTVQKARVTANGIEGSAGTDNAVYGYVNNGTKAHIIRPKRAKALRFQTGYRPKTRFRTLVSISGAGAYGPFAYAQVVHHPGTKPREFDYTIADMRQPDYEKACQEAITKAVKDGNN